MRCSVQFCTNHKKRVTKGQGITFHLFPKNPSLRKKWISVVGRKHWMPKEKSAVCSEHFHDEDFYDTQSGQRRLKSGAVPIVNQICRICLVMDTKMHHLKECRLDDTFQQLTGITLKDADRLPQTLCWECAHRLLASRRLRTKALRSHTLMMELVQSARYITTRDIATVNRRKNHLKSSLVHNVIEADEYDMKVSDVGELKTEKPTEAQERVTVKPEYETETELEREVEIDCEEDYVDNTENNPLKVEVELKNENYEEVFAEYVNCDIEDDKKPMVVFVKPKKLLQSEKGKMKKRVPKRSEEVQNPAKAMDKYKKTGVKRRKVAGDLDETMFTVQTLTYDEQISEIQERQLSTKYKNAVYKCTVCYRGFQSEERMDAHTVRHSEQSGAFECFICKGRMRTAGALRKHLTAQHTEKISCNQCAFVTRSRSGAREHKKWHDGTRYQCPHCPNTFDRMTTYLSHIRIKHPSYFVCEFCGYTFVSQNGIDIHKRRQHRDEPVTLEGPYCDVCDVTFVSEEAHSRHLKLSSKHSSEHDPDRIRNDFTSKSSQDGRAARNITRRPDIRRDDRDRAGHGQTAGPVTCEQCGIELGDHRVYAAHFRREHPDKHRTLYAMRTPWMCEQCGKFFQSMSQLKGHMWVHTGEKRFKCDHCDKSFSQKTNLMIHLKVHNDSRLSYECPVCGKQFAFLNNRNRHMFIHTGLKPFKCDTCGKCFGSKAEVRAHVDHVHLKKPWPKRMRGPRQRTEEATED